MALALVVLAVAGLAVLVAGDRDGSSDGGQAAPTTASAEPTGQGESDGAAPSSSSAQGGQTSATVAFTDPTTGFKVSYPRGWQVSRNGAATDFRDSRSGTYLRVEHVQPPGPSPVDAWFRQETSFAPQHPGYRRIDISSTEFKGRPAAVWEFTYLEGGAELHALDLGFTTPTRGFAMYFQTRAADWERMKPTFEALKQSFVVP